MGGSPASLLPPTALLGMAGEGCSTSKIWHWELQSSFCCLPCVPPQGLWGCCAFSLFQGWGCFPWLPLASKSTVPTCRVSRSREGTSAPGALPAACPLSPWRALALELILSVFFLCVWCSGGALSPRLGFCGSAIPNCLPWLQPALVFLAVRFQLFFPRLMPREADELQFAAASPRAV